MARYDAKIWQDTHRYRAYSRLSGWFLTGTWPSWTGRYFSEDGDDLIKIGENIGPAKSSRYMRRPAVHEAAVISKEASLGKSSLKAFLTVSEGFKPSMRLRHEIRAFVKPNLSSAVQLSEVEFIGELPKTRSGKLLRRVLRARELGLPEGDLLGLQDEPFRARFLTGRRSALIESEDHGYLCFAVIHSGEARISIEPYGPEIEGFDGEPQPFQSYRS
jgi:hypothetical protein